MKKTDGMKWATNERLRYELEKHPGRARYLKWKKKYSKIMGKFKELSIECVVKKRHFGMWLIANKLRWDYWWEFDEEFKISNDYTALITRELMLEIPIIREFCRIKRMRWADNFESLKAQKDFYLSDGDLDQHRMAHE